MFANIRKHQKWLWVLISAAVIISFVWYFNPSSSSGASSVFGVNPAVGEINGQPIRRNEFLEARREAELRFLFTYGSWPGSDEFSRMQGDFVERETKNRLLLKQKVKEHDIHVTSGEVSRWIFEAFGRERPFTEADYDRFLKQTLEPHGVREADLVRYVKNELAIMHLANVAVPGRLVTPQEAEAQYRRENEQVSADAVFFSATNYVAQVNLDPAAIGAHYTNQAAFYRVPERLQVTYVSFDATNYYAQADQKLAAITNLTQRIDEMYLQRGANFYTDTNDQVLPPEAAKQRIREELRLGSAMIEARKAANEFMEELLNLPGARQTANLENLAANKGLIAKTSEPFTQFDGPQGLDVPERFGQAAFMLTLGDPYLEEPVVGSDSVYVVALKRKIPSEVPPLDSIRERVIEDYKRIQSQTLAREAGRAFQQKLTNAIASGKTFTAAATELGEKVVSLAPFSQMSRAILGLDPRFDPSAIKGTAFSLKEGETSSFVPARDGGFVLQVNKFIPVADDVVKAALPPYLANLQRSGQGEAFGGWFGNEMEEAKLSLVTDRKASDAGEQDPSTPVMPMQQ